MDESIETALGPIVKEISKVFKKEKGQFLIVGPDRTLLDHLKEIIAVESGYTPVTVTRDRPSNPKNKIFFLNLLPTQSIEYQSLLYYYLELPLKRRCFVCLISTSSMCLNTLEKRVLSRFKNFTFFVPYLESGLLKEIPSEDLTKTGTDCFLPKPSNIIPSVEQRKKCEFMMKHGLVPFTVAFVLDFFEPIHFALIMAAKRYNITFLNVVSIFRKLTVNVNEMKGAEENQVLFCYYDLVDFGIISEQGSLIVDFGECHSFIINNCPLYIKKMLRTLG
ncbi:origin recognition complex subunit 4 [Pancytospora epiphaga]|nr:origin recognition complex subunit 4 [Pancytospora epiphaga]